MAEKVLHEWTEGNRVCKILPPKNAFGGHILHIDHGDGTSTEIPTVDRMVVEEVLRLSAELAEAKGLLDKVASHASEPEFDLDELLEEERRTARTAGRLEGMKDAVAAVEKRPAMSYESPTSADAYADGRADAEDKINHLIAAAERELAGGKEDSE